MKYFENAVKDFLKRLIRILNEFRSYSSSNATLLCAHIELQVGNFNYSIPL